MEAVLSSVTAKDLDELTLLHMDCFSSYMNVQMGKKYVRKTLQYFLAQPGAVFLKAAINNQIIGYTLGETPGFTPNMTRQLIWPALHAFISRPSLLFQKRFIRAIAQKINRAIFSRMGSTPAEKELQGPGIYLLSIGVGPGSRKTGVAQLLLNAFERSATQQGMHYMRLFSYRENKDAINAYRSAGWEILSETPTGYYFFKRITPAV